MDINSNKYLIEKLKTNIWKVYRDTKAGDWKDWFKNLSDVEQAAWKEKFNEVQEEFDKKRPE